MIPLRIGFDMDGTLADLSTAYAQIEERLFGSDLAEHDRPAPEAREAEQHRDESIGASATTRDNRRSGDRRRGGTDHRDRVGRAMEDTPDFWITLRPLERGAVARLYELTIELNWEVFFITQRPATAGATVQLQTQRWLIEHGFRTPSGIPLAGARGKCAAALHLDYLVDDMPRNCVDVLSESSTRSILLVDADDPLADT